jgi:hypothetical protein
MRLFIVVMIKKLDFEFIPEFDHDKFESECLSNWVLLKVCIA